MGNYIRQNLIRVHYLAFASFILGLLVLVPQNIVHAAPTPPAGFQTNLLIDTGLTAPTGIGIAPDGRIFILEQGGAIKIYKNGALLPQVFATLPAYASGDRGLLGVAFDPDFNTNHFVYFYYVDTDLAHHVVRFDATGDVANGDPLVIYDSNSIANLNHAGGTIQFGPDGKLYIGIGDSGNGANAQDLSVPMGKILRINKDGTIPSDNPFVGQAGKLPEIWAYGFRNPFRFQFDSVTGRLYLGDVGQDTWEEIDIVTKGGNYGWPIIEGMCTSSCGGYINPIYVYQHTTPGFAVVGGPVYRGSMFPSDYYGRLFYGDYGKGFIKTLTLDANGNETTVNDFDLNAGSITDLKVAPDGSIYYVTIFPGKLYRIVSSNANLSPYAVASADKTSGPNPLTVTFSSAGSTDPEGQPLTYDWDFGDGTHSASSSPVKTYTQKGQYIVVLHVSDGVNVAQAPSFTVQVGTPPTLTISSPTQGLIYRAGDTISYSATGSDSDGNALPDSAFTRQVVFHHNTHIHPFIPASQSRTGTFVIPTTGEVSPDTWYEIIMTATDANGLVTTKSVTIFPKKTNITFKTNPAGLYVTMEGIPETDGTTIQAVSGFNLDLDVPNQSLATSSYIFDHWSDGSAKAHTITVPDSATSYTAFFKAIPPFTAQYFNNMTLSGTPVLTRAEPLINNDWGNGSPDLSVNADHFSARWTRQQDFAFGRYKFTITGDDGVRLFIDGVKVIDGWKDQAATSYSTTTDLTAGSHEIKMEYYEDGGGAVAKLNWDLTPDQPTPPALPPATYPDYKGEYFNNKNLTGSSTLVRNDTSVNFDWGGGSPDPSLPVDLFSARWTKTSNFDAGVYDFTVTADDGVRLFVDDEKIIDAWKDQPATSYTVRKSLTAGNHIIRIEYYENAGGAVAKFNYQLSTDQTPPAPADSYDAQYYSNQNLSGTPVVTEKDPAINFNWGNGSPDPQIPVDHFSARWTKNQNFDDGYYEFDVTADDGVRLIIDGQTVIDKWINQPATAYSYTGHLTAGSHTIVVEYYENSGQALAQMSYHSVAAPAPVGFTGQYFTNMTLNGSPVLTRQDPAINFVWNSTAPDPSVGNVHYSVRWTKDEVFAAGPHTFTLRSDDGIRFYVDNTLLVDDWNDHAMKIDQKQVTLTAGTHNLKVEYYQNEGGAVAILEY